MRGRLLLAPLVLLLVLLGAACDPAQNPYVDIGTPHSEERPDPCQEDEPCWDCHTMGNRICGPLTAEVWQDGTDVFDGDGNFVDYQWIGDDGHGGFFVGLVGDGSPLRVFAENVTHPDQA